ncbi:MAG: isochorismatase family protein [Actinophytocola sp.]|nr:isochorismatase family protein [Actinophytocola sp.]
MDRCWDDVIGPDERLIAARYQTDRTPGSRPALLLIDCYRKVFGDRPRPLADAIDDLPATCGLSAWRALDPLRQLLKTAREVRVPVLYTTGQRRTDARLGATTRRVREPGEDVAAGYEIVAELAPRPGELVLDKSRASAFFGTPLSTWLRQLDVDTLVVGGETTSGCVRASVVDAYSHGFEVIVVEDATFDRSELSHKVNLFDMHLKYASVRRLAAALDYLSQRPFCETTASSAGRSGS